MAARGSGGQPDLLDYPLPAQFAKEGRFEEGTQSFTFSGWAALDLPTYLPAAGAPHERAATYLLFAL